LRRQLPQPARGQLFADAQGLPLETVEATRWALSVPRFAPRWGRLFAALEAASLATRRVLWHLGRPRAARAPDRSYAVYQATLAALEPALPPCRGSA
jgi:hypothetical protein